MKREPTFWDKQQNIYRIVRRLGKVLHTKKLPYKDYRVWLISQGCIVCGQHKTVNAHHVGKPGTSLKDVDFGGTIGLCHLHHQGSKGIHSLGKKGWQKTFPVALEVEARNCLARFIRLTREEMLTKRTMSLWIERHKHKGGTCG